MEVIKMKTIYEALSVIRNKAKSEKDKGTQFERLSRFFLKNDPLWSVRFSDVWMWKDAPTNTGADIGIDLVAQDKEDGSLWAIQCKCYADEETLPYTDVGTFYGKTGNKGVYKHTMIITSAGRYSTHLDEVAKEWGTIRIFLDDMASSEIDYEPWIKGKTSTKRVYKEPLRHQVEAIDDCIRGFKEHDRGQLIMACGTGKTLTSLRLAERLFEDEGKKGGRVLFLAPSIALVGQSMRAWANQAKIPMICAVVCSDAKASSTDTDVWESSLRDLPYPASTDSQLLYEQLKSVDDKKELVVVFSTYQSIQVVADAQKKGLPAFDLIICDEAHRSTGVVAAGISKSEISEYVKVHDNSIVSGKKRIYMTATPRLYGDRAKKIAKVDSYIVSSMDDEKTFGPEFHHLSFGRAVDEDLLSDYKVIALNMSESEVSEVYQRAMFEEDEFAITESAKIIGCWKGLLNQGEENGIKLKNAVAFCSTIAESQRMTDYFERTVSAYIDYEKEQGKELPEFRCKIRHVDGTMDAKKRRDLLRWIEETESGDQASCRILSNARCLAEGVDVPNLDAVLFLQPKKSQIDITQAVGRVMRKFKGKKYGYIILPIVIPAGMTEEEALDNSEAYGVVWDILKALRSHDERLDARINALPYDKKQADPVVKIVSAGDFVNENECGDQNSNQDSEKKEDEQQFRQLHIYEYMSKLQEMVNAQIVRKCGTKVYWDLWAKDIAEIAKKHINRIHTIIQKDETVNKEFQRFLCGLRDSLNNSISVEQAIEMLSQHIITLPIFEALFGGNDFSGGNPVSSAMDKMLSVLRSQTIETEQEKRELRELYASVRMRAEGIRTDAGRQAVIKDLYESFFKKAFKATSEKMGIVYTPNQIVDYMLHATDRILFKEFGQHLCDADVHILDAFTGTGTFIVNLINNKTLLPLDKLPYKYANEIHANEIMLLAYYIATINIEHAYHARIETDDYTSFQGAVLTDTFQMYEEGDAIDRDIFIENTARGLTQMAKPIHVLIGNPPWSIGQKSANDNNANEEYPTLRKRIEETYSAKSSAIQKRGLYDAYIHAFRWASDRIGEKGIVAYITNGGWLRGAFADGFRRCLLEEFNSIYVFDLRGNARTKGEKRRKEKDNVFGQGTRTPVTITMLIKNPNSLKKRRIFYHDIGDYLTREEKLSIVASSCEEEQFEWKEIYPDKHFDWLDHRDNSWKDFSPLGLNNKFGRSSEGLFSGYSLGVNTARDAWTYNFNKQNVENNIKRFILLFNTERHRWEKEGKGKVEDFVLKDTKQIKWSVNLYKYIKRNSIIKYDKDTLCLSLYRPFCKQWFYFNSYLNERPGQQKALFPKGHKNVTICTSAGNDFSVLIAHDMPNYHFIGDTQCFPLYWYEQDDAGKYKRHDGITNITLDVFRKAFPSGIIGRLKKDGGPEISKKDIFYYIYGILHSPEYRERFDANLKKELPRIPLSRNFTSFVAIGRQLANLHLNYEQAELYPLEVVGDIKTVGRVIKMRWGKKYDPKTGQKVDDHSVLVYNESLTFKKIPEEADRYFVNGLTPLEWLIELYQVKTDKASGIVNDPNEYTDDPLYIPYLIQRIVTVSVETTRIVEHMPALAEMGQIADWPEEWK